VCYQRVRVDDVVITGRQNHHRIETCGVVVVKKFAHVHADILASGTGILVEGEVQARSARTPSLVLGPQAVWSGDVEAQSLSIDPASTIKGGRFQIRTRAKKRATAG
jgi:cytoskeletal protein CcmA (bactofilin family)